MLEWLIFKLQTSNFKLLAMYVDFQWRSAEQRDPRTVHKATLGKRSGRAEAEHTGIGVHWRHACMARTAPFPTSQDLSRQAFPSAMKLDPVVIELLSLDPSNTNVSSHGGGGCSSASTSKITSKLNDDTEKCFFMKTGRGKDAEIMFEGSSYPFACQWPNMTLTKKRWTFVAQCSARCCTFTLPATVWLGPVCI